MAFARAWRRSAAAASSPTAAPRAASGFRPKGLKRLASMAAVARLKRRPEFLAVAASRRRWVAPGLILQAARRPEDSKLPSAPAHRLHRQPQGRHRRRAQPRAAAAESRGRGDPAAGRRAGLRLCRGRPHPNRETPLCRSPCRSRDRTEARAREAAKAGSGVMGLLLRGLIGAYQLLLSPLLLPSCRFEPSCSHYAQEAIATHGAHPRRYPGRCGASCAAIPGAAAASTPCRRHAATAPITAEHHGPAKKSHSRHRPVGRDSVRLPVFSGAQAARAAADAGNEPVDASGRHAGRTGNHNHRRADGGRAIDRHRSARDRAGTDPACQDRDAAPERLDQSRRRPDRRSDSDQLSREPDPKSPEIVLLAPEGTANPYFAEFGWVAADTKIKMPGAEYALDELGRRADPGSSGRRSPGTTARACASRAATRSTTITCSRSRRA